MIFSYLLFLAQAFAHGEHLPGPHSGFIQMPAGFHVEVVPKSSNLEIYLLDIEFKNPLVEGSGVKASLHRGTKISSLACTAGKISFTCSLPRGEKLKTKGELRIRANRAGQEANEAVFSIPLKRPAAAQATAEESSPAMPRAHSH